MLPSSSMAPKIILATFFVIFCLKFYSANSEIGLKVVTGIQAAASDEKDFSNFTDTVKQKNPSVSTLLSIGGGNAKYSTLSTMVSNSSFRKSFIDSSIKTARVYGFQGLDLCWVSANSSSDMYNMGVLFEEWRAAIELEVGNASQAKLILTAAVQFQPGLDSGSFPAKEMEQ
ncbi:hypothetical protein Pint_14609 [Pistacia integerrima]|uniref:Uncharacterized protein n=1 Tax=Pistacia integerrima TaxID=434235 RepID=A0ACC0YBB0_9ROSI|nr:hypothetical protein Pint_14609 [Pistacia integerrima]